MNVIVLLVVFAAITAVYGWLMKHVALKGLHLSRSFSRRAVFEGEEAELVEVVVNDRPFIIPWLRVESRISPHLRFGSRENLDVSGEMYHQSLFTVMPYQRITRRHKVHFLHRGAYDIGNAALTAGDVTGGGQCTREQHMNVPVLVYPRLLEDHELPVPLTRLTGEWALRQQLLHDPFLINGIRTYQPGDPVRDIHWPATARMGETQVRLHDPSAQARLMVLINGQLSDDQWDNLMDYEQPRIERVISMAATLCVHALRAGLTAGFAANMPLDTHSHECTVLMPSGGSAREEELLAAFARLKILRLVSFNPFLASLAELTDMDIVVLTCYESEALHEQINRLSRQGNRVTLHVLDGGGGAA